MYIINPKEFTQIIKKKKRVYPKEVRKKEKDNQRGHRTRENQWNYLNFAIVLVTRCTNVLNNPVKDRGIVLNEKTCIRDLSNLNVQIN